MKKIICGAMLLLAAAVCFTGCKKDENKNDSSNGGSNGGSGGSTAGVVVLSEDELNLFLNQTERIYANYSAGSGKFTWTSEDESVATVTSRGEITAEGYGTTNIVCTEASGAKATCKVNVVTMLETFKSFPTASVAIPEVKDNTMYDLFKIKLDDMEDSVMVRAYLAETAIRLFSEGTYYANGSGELTGPEMMAMMYIPAFVYYIDHTTCPEAVEEGKHVINGLTSRYFETTMDTVANGLVPSIVNNEAYWTHITAAAEAWTNGDTQSYYKECMLASSEGVTGAALTIYKYDAEDGYQPVSWMPDAIITRAKIGLIGNEDYEYMYYVNGAVEIQPILGDYGLGVYVEEDDFGTMTIKSEKMELGENKIFKLQIPQAESAPARGNKAEFLKSLEKMKSAPKDVQLSKKVK